MRRAVPTLVATVGGLALIASFHTGGAVKPNFVASPAKSPSTAATGAPPPSSESTTTRATSDDTTGTTGTTSTTTRATVQKADGQVVDTQFGPVEVEVIAQGGTVTDVRALQLPFDHRRSQEISQQVAPLLHDEALQAQSANIDLISGATYTSDAYAQSLQSALDRLRA